MTHIANEVGIAYNRGTTRKIRIRETKLYWVSQYGTKYRKESGSIVGGRYSTFELDINSIREMI